LQRPSWSATWQRIIRLRQRRRLRNAATLGLVVLGPVLALVTYLVLGPFEQGGTSTGLRLILLADLVYTLVVAALVALRVAQMIAARRAQSAGSRLHLRLTGVFALVALVPTILVAVFATLTVNFGLEGWFSQRVQSVVGASLEAARTYEAEHRKALEADAGALADLLDRAHRHAPFMSDGELRQILGRAQTQIQRGLKEAYVINGIGQIRARGDGSYLFDYEKPDKATLARALGGKMVLIKDWNNDEFRALVRLSAFPDRLLYVTRRVDGNILNLLDTTQNTARLYQRLEHDRGRLLFEFALLYLGFATLLILAATWLGLWFAERLARPVGRLAAAAQRVGQGDLDVLVHEEEGDDEIAMLGRLFNQMTRQLKGQRDALLANNRETERQRRLFDSVLSSVTAGVIGLDSRGRVDFLNRSAVRLLDLDAAAVTGGELALAVPEFDALFQRLIGSSGEAAQEEIPLNRESRHESLLVRMATRRNSRDELEGYVVAFDDVTELVSAQRMAAWGDVARRIAHEIKNPLTPIQLSAERLRRNFGPLLESEKRDGLEQLTSVIIRQTGDLRRIVDEFSKFARMPEPDRREHDIVQLVRDAVVLQGSAAPEVRFTLAAPAERHLLDIDDTMISQALTNLIKNAGEAIESAVKKHIEYGYAPEIRVALLLRPNAVEITVADNGIGLPANVARLFEPYVTTRAKGTGLGLAIVRKIVEEHGGTLTLSEAPAFAPGAHCGALARIILPETHANHQKDRHKRRQVA